MRAVDAPDAASTSLSESITAMLPLPLHPLPQLLCRPIHLQQSPTQDSQEQEMRRAPQEVSVQHNADGTKQKSRGYWSVEGGICMR